ncbi:hypothetical protein HDU85_003318 [Gaertneriomyces sp. JEL0708]|nr:hypothetical protein HDU85_003318 [Gaertneriomyces sp. JEL0708]
MPDKAAARRIEAISSQLAKTEISGLPAYDGEGSVEKSKYAFNENALADLLDHDNQDLRREFQSHHFTKPLFSSGLLRKTIADKGLHGHRDLTLERVKYAVQNKMISVRDYLADPLKFQAFLETAGIVDSSFAIKAGVHFTLCGGTIMSLGTPEQHDVWAPKLDDFTLPGCFAMTELGHGSNVLGIETTATFDKATNEFIINTPHEAAQKSWIGGAALHARITTCFAQLVIDGVNYGVHAFVVPLRNEKDQLLPGVFAADNGLKLGLNGVDNGRLWFKHVRVPLFNLLAKYASVEAKTGKYVSPIADPAVRFATMLGALVGGRVLLATGGCVASQLGLLVAIRYAFNRTQFPADGQSGAEVSIMSYLSHQRKLFPALATTVITRLSVGHLKNLFAARTPETMKQVHVLAAGLKAYSTWHRGETLRVCREACGGQGFAYHNMIAPLMLDNDIDTTFEGDNTVLLLQVTKAILNDFRKAAKSGNAPLPETPDEPTSPRDLTSLPYLRALYTYRLRDLVVTLVAELQRTVKSKRARTFTEAWNQNLDLVTSVAVAHVEQVLLDRVDEILNASNTEADPSVRPAIQLLARLHALDRLERDMGYFVSAGLLGPEERQLVRREINNICGEMYQSRMALEVVNGFGFDERLIYAPIAKANYVALHANQASFLVE